MNNHYYENAILILAFNRPSKTRTLLNRLKNIKPNNLYVALDGPRKKNDEDIINCSAVLKAFELIDWDCSIKFLKRTENLGCSRAIVGALNWFFEHEDYGIIFEDDCIPDLTFFPFCDELLDRYSDSDQIMMISGTNLGVTSVDDSYFFSKYGQIYGWATWKRAWNKYEIDIVENGIDDKFSSKAEMKFWKRNFNKILWDVQWAIYSIWKNNGLAVVPNINLVQNIGFDNEGTHYKDPSNVKANIRTEKMIFPLIHPNKINKNEVIDEFIFKSKYHKSFYIRIFNKLFK